MSSTKKIEEKTFWRIKAIDVGNVKYSRNNKEIQFILEATGYLPERIKELITTLYKNIEVIELTKLDFNPFASAAPEETK